MKQPDAAIVGFLLAPIISVTYMAVGLVTTDAASKIAPADFIWLAMVYGYSLMAVLLVGVPTFFIVRYFWKVTVLTVFIAGFVDGILAAILFHPWSYIDARLILEYGLLGMGSAFIFWLVFRLAQDSALHDIENNDEGSVS